MRNFGKDFEKYILGKTEKEFGYADDYQIPEGLDVVQKGGAKFITRPGQKKASTLFVFLHIGVSVDPEFVDQFKDDHEAIADTVYENYDRGGRKIADELLKDLPKEDADYAVVIYEMSRVQCDGNRTTRDEQVVMQPYKGINTWNTEFPDREAIGAKLVDPMVNYLEQFVKELRPKFIFYPHTYDQFGGGTTSGGHEVVKGAVERPVSMIFNHHELKENAYGMYYPEQEIYIDLLTKKQIEVITEVQKKHLGDFEIPVDYPYASPRQLPLTVSHYFKGPQLVLEYRKDLFKQGWEHIVDAVKEINTKILETVGV